MKHMPSICTMSLGRCFAGHSLVHKLDMAKKYGFLGIEVFYEDLVDFANITHGDTTDASQIAAAHAIRELCGARGLEVITLQPLMHFGALFDRGEQARHLDEAQRLWFKLSHALGTDLILLPSSFLGEDKVSADMDLLAADMRELADLGLAEEPPIRFAHEALCWGTHVVTWEQSWELVQRVDRPNFGICFDTFNIAGRIYADPASKTACASNADAAFLTSMQTLLSTVDVSKIFLLQVADAERLASPLGTPSHPFYHPEQPARMSWSRNCRLFYGEGSYGAYLPVQTILSVLVQGLGFEGWLSFEVFNRALTEERAEVPEEMARRAAGSWQRMVRGIGLSVEDETMETRVQAML